MGHCVRHPDYPKQSSMKKEKSIKVNICWELGDERKCETMDKNDAYATRDYTEKNGGVVFWFQPLED